METVKAGRTKSYLLLAALLLGFLGMLAAFGPALYNDSDQYIRMHIHREPLYPLFLWIIRGICGAGWLYAAGVIQNVLAAVSIWFFAEYLYRKFSLLLWEEILVVLLGIIPYLFTRYFSVLRIFIPNSVMSEALCLPLFLFFITGCFDMFTAGEKQFWKAAMKAGILALVLSLTRSQMMAAILVWMVVLVVRTLRGKAEFFKKMLRLCGIVGIVALAFLLRLFLVKCYNLAFNGHFINNTYGGVNTLTNILYVSDREDGENIKDEEAREFFYLMYDMADEREAAYRYAGSSFAEKAEHIEKWHDTIKFEIIEDLYYQTYKKTVVDDYIIINLRADETSMKIIKGILPKCFGRWLTNYLILAAYGMIRSIAVVHPVMNWIAGLFYLLSMGMAVFMIQKNRRKGQKTDNAVWFYLLTMLFILGNVCTVSITIMTLSRYMIYGFSLFYTACFLLLITAFRTWQKERAEKGLQSWAIRI